MDKTVDELIAARKANLEAMKIEKVVRTEFDIKTLEVINGMVFPKGMTKTNILEALVQLCALAKHDEMYGKTAFYKERIGDAIEKAEDIINEVYEATIFYENHANRKRKR